MFLHPVWLPGRLAARKSSKKSENQKLIMLTQFKTIIKYKLICLEVHFRDIAWGLISTQPQQISSITIFLYYYYG